MGKVKLARRVEGGEQVNNEPKRLSFYKPTNAFQGRRQDRTSRLH